MTIWTRLRNLWKLSEGTIFYPETYPLPTSYLKLKEIVDDFTTYAHVGNYDELVKKQNKKRMATVIPRKKRDPIKEIIGNETAI